jgi:hypothetical protein
MCYCLYRPRTLDSGRWREDLSGEGIYITVSGLCLGPVLCLVRAIHFCAVILALVSPALRHFVMKPAKQPTDKLKSSLVPRSTAREALLVCGADPSDPFHRVS